MKTVADMKISEKAIIKKIIAKEPIKSRLFAMGIVKGAVIRVLEYTLAKQTWDVVSNNTKIALREEEARGIIVDE